MLCTLRRKRRKSQGWRMEVKEGEGLPQAIVSPSRVAKPDSHVWSSASACGIYTHFCYTPDLFISSFRRSDRGHGLGVSQSHTKQDALLFKQVLFPVEAKCKEPQPRARLFLHHFLTLAAPQPFNSGLLCLLSVIHSLDVSPCPGRKELSSAQASLPCLSHLCYPLTPRTALPQEMSP